jgi:glycosyltransferase involved in cell wall biosynthesis
MSGPNPAVQPSPVKRAVILEAYPHLLGGAQRVNLALAAALPAHGWATEVVAPGEGAATDALRAAGIAVVVLPAGAGLHRFGHRRPSPRTAVDLAGWWRRLAHHLRASRGSGPGTTLLVSDQRGLILGAPAARLARIPVVWHLHSAEQSSLLRRAGAALAAAVVAPSHRTAARVDGGRARVVPDGVAARPPAPPAAPDAPPAVLSVGRLHPDKDLATLLHAAARLRCDRPDLEVTIVGAEQEGHEEYARSLRAQVAALGIGDTVSFTGARDDPLAGVGDRTVYVQSSVRETFGLALAEAMAAGLPVVATATDGTAELVADGRTGLVVDPGDPAALAAAVDRLLGDPELARSLGTAARADVSRRYSPEAMVAAELQVLDAVTRR